MEKVDSRIVERVFNAYYNHQHNLFTKEIVEYGAATKNIWYELSIADFTGLVPDLEEYRAYAVTVLIVHKENDRKYLVSVPEGSLSKVVGRSYEDAKHYLEELKSVDLKDINMYAYKFVRLRY